MQVHAIVNFTFNFTHYNDHLTTVEPQGREIREVCHPRIRMSQEEDTWTVEDKDGSTSTAVGLCFRPRTNEQQHYRQKTSKH